MYQSERWVFFSFFPIGASPYVFFTPAGASAAEFITDLRICVKSIKFSPPRRSAHDLCNLVIFQYTICGCRRPNLKLEAADLLLGVANARDSRKVCCSHYWLTRAQYFARGKLFRFTKCKKAARINSWCALLSHFYIDLMPKPCMKTSSRETCFWQTIN